MRDSDKVIWKDKVLLGSFLVDYGEAGEFCTVFSLNKSKVEFAFDIKYKLLEELWAKAESIFEFYSLVWREYESSRKKTK